MTTFSTSREIPAAVEQVFAALSQPERLSRWWGPAGFTNTFSVCEFKNGGRWSFIMHGPDGKSYPNENVFAEIQSPKKIVIQHVSGPEYRLTIALASAAVGTIVSWSQAFESSAAASHIEHIVVPANEQNLDRLSVEVLRERFRQVKAPELASELYVRFHSDQAARQALIDFQAKHKLAGEVVAPADTEPKIAAEYKTITEKLQAEDQKNLAWLKGVVAKHGWPGESLVGSIGAQNAWLLVQHADTDPNFQKTCLEMMEAMPKGEVVPINIAYLTDRTLVGDGKKQKYGTQATFNDGKLVAAPIEDEDGVDDRRKALGLEPLSEYLKTMES